MRRVISTKYYTYRFDFGIILFQPNHYFWRQIHTTLLKYLYIKWDVVQYLNISNHIEYEIWVSNEIMEGRTSFIHSLYVRNSIGRNYIQNPHHIQYPLSNPSPFSLTSGRSTDTISNVLFTTTTSSCGMERGQEKVASNLTCTTIEEWTKLHL